MLLQNTKSAGRRIVETVTIDENNDENGPIITARASTSGAEKDGPGYVNPVLPGDDELFENHLEAIGKSVAWCKSLCNQHHGDIIVRGQSNSPRLSDRSPGSKELTFLNCIWEHCVYVEDVLGKLEKLSGRVEQKTSRGMGSTSRAGITGPVTSPAASAKRNDDDQWVRSDQEIVVDNRMTRQPEINSRGFERSIPSRSEQKQQGIGGLRPSRDERSGATSDLLDGRDITENAPSVSACDYEDSKTPLNRCHQRFRRAMESYRELLQRFVSEDNLITVNDLENVFNNAIEPHFFHAFFLDRKGLWVAVLVFFNDDFKDASVARKSGSSPDHALTRAIRAAIGLQVPHDSTPEPPDITRKSYRGDIPVLKVKHGSSVHMFSGPESPLSNEAITPFVYHYAKFKSVTHASSMLLAVFLGKYRTAAALLRLDHNLAAEPLEPWLGHSAAVPWVREWYPNPAFRILADLCRAKFSQCLEAQEALLAISTTSIHLAGSDRFLSCGYRQSEDRLLANMGAQKGFQDNLGMILTELRNEIRRRPAMPAADKLSVHAEGRAISRSRSRDEPRWDEDRVPSFNHQPTTRNIPALSHEAFAENGHGFWPPKTSPALDVIKSLGGRTGSIVELPDSPNVENMEICETSSLPDQQCIPGLGNDDTGDNLEREKDRLAAVLGAQSRTAALLFPSSGKGLLPTPGGSASMKTSSTTLLSDSHRSLLPTPVPSVDKALQRDDFTASTSSVVEEQSSILGPKSKAPLLGGGPNSMTGATDRIKVLDNPIAIGSRDIYSIEEARRLSAEYQAARDLDPCVKYFDFLQINRFPIDFPIAPRNSCHNHFLQVLTLRKWCLSSNKDGSGESDGSATIPRNFEDLLSWFNNKADPRFFVTSFVLGPHRHLVILTFFNEDCLSSELLRREGPTEAAACQAAIESATGLPLTPINYPQGTPSDPVDPDSLFVAITGGTHGTRGLDVSIVDVSQSELAFRARTPFSCDFVDFISLKQAYLVHMAIYFGRLESLASMLNTQDPIRLENLGHSLISGIQANKEQSWFPEPAFSLVYKLSRAKIESNPAAKDALLDTGDAHIHTSSSHWFFGCGFEPGQEAVLKQSGIAPGYQSMMGAILTHIRDDFKDGRDGVVLEDVPELPLMPSSSSRDVCSGSVSRESNPAVMNTYQQLLNVIAAASGIRPSEVGLGSAHVATRDSSVGGSICGTAGTRRRDQDTVELEHRNRKQERSSRSPPCTLRDALMKACGRATAGAAPQRLENIDDAEIQEIARSSPNGRRTGGLLDNGRRKTGDSGPPPPRQRGLIQLPPDAVRSGEPSSSGMQNSFFGGSNPPSTNIRTANRLSKPSFFGS